MHSRVARGVGGSYDEVGPMVASGDFLDELFGIRGKTALVTGATRGIGRGIADAMAKAGARVIVTGRRRDAAVAVARDIGKGAIGLQLDLLEQASIKGVVENACAAAGRIDILVNNAGIYPAATFAEATGEHWDEVHNVNVRGAFLMLREVAARMKGSGGNIVNISSMGSVRPAAPIRFAYNASKAALNRLTEDAASAFAADGIRVNAILPGPIEVAEIDPSNDAALKIRDAVLRRVPVGRYGSPRDIAAAAIYLVSNASSFVTGQTLVVDGGFLVR